MQHFDAAATRQRLPWPALIAALRAMFISGCELPARHVHTVHDAAGVAVGSVLLMPAWRPGGRLGVKTVGVFPGNDVRGLPSLHATYQMFDATTGVPLATIDGAELTARRTAAVSALAASFLARADASRLLVVGAGRVASGLAPAMSAVRPIRHVMVWNHRAAGARALAQRWCEQGLHAEAVDDIEAALAVCDIVSCATLAAQPLLRGAWLREGTHADLIGSFAPDTREADAACIQRAEVFVDHDEAVSKGGDLVQAAREGVFAATDLRATLAQLCRGDHGGRATLSQITLFKSVGSALQDLAAAELVLDQGDGIRPR
jgi:ornithine cyclodeaminase